MKGSDIRLRTKNKLNNLFLLRTQHAKCLLLCHLKHRKLANVEQDCVNLLLNFKFLLSKYNNLHNNLVSISTKTDDVKTDFQAFCKPFV